VQSKFSGPSYTIGIEEELMILDPESLGLVNGIDALLEETDDAEHVKPELLESVLEIATPPAPDTRVAGAELRRLRADVRAAAERRGLAIGSAGTHPFALWEDQRVTQEERYRELVATLHFVARQELIFGLHVHVGLDDADKAIHVANGMRAHAPVLLALSANSPFWRARATGLASGRMPIFRTFPRVGMPPAYAGWDDFAAKIEFLERSGVIEDYTWMWYDVRPHPNFGTVEIRAMDAQTRIEHTLGLAALIQAMVHELAEHYDAGRELPDLTTEVLDENRWLAARFGLEGELVDLPSSGRVPSRELARRLVDRLEPRARELGSAAELEGVRDLIENGTGAERQMLVYAANEDFRDVLREIVETTAPETGGKPSGDA
jgi:glutamate---cysteine ligase / carboxylate-amine ligase